MAGKWLELLKECAPTIARVAILFNPDIAPSSVYLPLIRAAAQLFSVELISSAVRNATEMETAIAQLGAQPGGGLLVMPDASIVTRIARPAQCQVFCCGRFRQRWNSLDQHKRAATYIDRILRGARPAE